MSRNRLLMLLGLMLVISISSTLVVYYGYYIIDIRSYDMEMRIVSPGDIGMNAETNYLKFGSFPPGSTAVKSISINNSMPIPVFVQIKLDGYLAPMVTPSDNLFILPAGEARDVAFTLTAPEGIAQGTYYGKAVIYLKRKL